MKVDTQTAPGMSSRASYMIRVSGQLPKHWADWFNGTIISHDPGHAGKRDTTLTCHVRDQAELLGVLNRLNNLYLPLLQVTLLERKESQDVE